MKVHCLFEQSGTFKNEFKKLGIDAIDYDIQNEFGETDRVIDLFGQIRGGYAGEPSIFDEISKDDLIMAFFPCIRFISKIHCWFLGNSYSQKKWDDLKKVEYDIKLHNELHELYDLFCKMSVICLQKGLKIIIENPYSYDHYLTQFFPIKSAIIDNDRSKRGDLFKKPTQFWFLNCYPKNNIIMGEDLQTPKEKIHSIKNGNYVCDTTGRSMISPIYANRFIREFIL